MQILKIYLAEIESGSNFDVQFIVKPAACKAHNGSLATPGIHPLDQSLRGMLIIQQEELTPPLVIKACSLVMRNFIYATVEKYRARNLAENVAMRCFLTGLIVEVTIIYEKQSFIYHNINVL